MGKRADKRRQRRAERKAARREARERRRQQRIDGKNHRTDSRQETKQAMIDAGLDPNAWVGEVGDMVSDVGKVFGGGGMPGRGGSPSAATVGGSVTLDGAGNKNTMMIAGAVGLGLLMILKKK